MIKERKLKLLMLIVICKLELLRRSNNPFDSILITGEIAAYVADFMIWSRKFENR